MDNEKEEKTTELDPKEIDEKTAPGEIAITPEMEIEALKKEILYQRAEFENARKRLVKEQETALKYANERLLRDLIPVIDLFDRGLGFAADLKSKNSGNKELENFVGGIELSHRELLQLLSRFGVEFIGQIGEKFSPERHEAISMQESSEEKVGLILAVASRGCLLHGRLLTPAKVIVGTGKEA